MELSVACMAADCQPRLRRVFQIGVARRRVEIFVQPARYMRRTMCAPFPLLDLVPAADLWHSRTP
jgi:hypothetical protein